LRVEPVGIRGSDLRCFTVGSIGDAMLAREVGLAGLHDHDMGARSESSNTSSTVTTRSHPGDGAADSVHERCRSGLRASGDQDVETCDRRGLEEPAACSLSDPIDASHNAGD
jgi:hypothetical protein